MNSLEKLSNEDLHQSALQAARRDRDSELDTILHLREVYKRRLHLEYGYSSLFQYAVSGLGFSEPAASQRTHAMGLTIAVPAVEHELQSGALSMSSAASVQRFIQREEGVSERKFTLEEKQQMVSTVSGKSVREAERLLLGFAAAPEPHIHKEAQRAVTPTRIEFKFFADLEFSSELERVRELKGTLSLEEIFKAALGVYLERIDPARKVVKGRVVRSPKTSESFEHSFKPKGLNEREHLSVAKPSPDSECPADPGRSPPPEPSPESNPPTSPRHSRYLPVADHRALHARSGGQCEYLHQKSGRRCSSRTQLQPDHRIPFAMGGPTQFENLRHYCPQHNRLAGIRVFGERKMRGEKR